MINIIQVIVIIFVLFAASRAFLRLRDKQITIIEFLFWISIWIAVAVFVLIPKITTFIARYAGIGRGVDIIVYLGIVLLLYLVFRMYVKIDHMEQEITKLVRIITIQDVKKKNKKR